MLSKRVQILSESATLAVTALANELKAKGEDVISFSAGEPDFDTPQVIKNAAIAAIQKGCAKYTNVAGLPAVLEAVQFKLRHENALDYDISEIITNVGAKHSLFECLQCLINHDDEVIIPSPFWVSYPEMVKYAHGKPVFIEGIEARGFKITPEQLKSALTPRTKVFMLNSPSNPVGAIYSKAELTALAKVLEGTVRWTPPLFMLFFVISGADLNISLLPKLGLIGIVYLIARSLGKYFGARLGATIAKADKNIRKYLGLTLLPQAGVAIGMAQMVISELPQYGADIQAVVLCATLIYEIIGPVATKIALVKAGEIRKDA